MIFTGKEAEKKFKEIFGTEKEFQKLIDEGYEKCDQKEYTMRELGLNNYGDETYYFTHKDEFEKDLKIAELEEENLKLKEKLKNAIVPKFKVGQKVYRIAWHSTYDLDYGFNIETNTIRNIHYHYKCDMSNISYDLSNGLQYLSEDELFATKEEAKKELNKIKGE